MPQPRFDRQQLVQAALGRGGGGGGAGGANLIQAVQAFMDAMGKSMTQFVRGATQAQAQQAEQTQAAVAQVADAAQRAVNQAEQRAETRRQEERQEALTEEGRRFQLEAMDYERALTSRVQREGAELASIIQENEAKKNRLLDEQERGAATIAESAESTIDWVYQMDAAHAWDRLGPNGLEVRQQMLDLARMSQVVREDMLDSPYADKLHAMVAQANQALIRGEKTFVEPAGAFEQPMLPIPAAMLESLKLDLPILTPEEAEEWELYNGYPKGGVWAMSMDDPKFVMVNPVSFRVITKAKQDDLMLAVMQSDESRREYLLKVAKDVAEADELMEPMEEAYKELRGSYATTLPDAVANALVPDPRRWEQTGAAPDQVMRQIYSTVLKNSNVSSEVVDRALRLGLPEGDPNKWQPGVQQDGESSADFQARMAEEMYDTVHVYAIADKAQELLDTAMQDPTFRGNIGAWLGSLRFAQLVESGVDPATATDIARARQKVSQRRPTHVFDFPPSVEEQMAIPAELAERAVSQVIGKWEAWHRQTMLRPIRTNTIINSWRENNHARAVLKDGHAYSVLSALEPQDLEGLVASGAISAQTAEAVRTGENRLFTAPVGVMKGILALHNRPGSRRMLRKYYETGAGLEDIGQGVRDPEDDPKSNPIRAHHENAARFGIESPFTMTSQFDAEAGMFESPLQGPAATPPRKERARPLMSYTDRVLKGRAQAMAVQAAPPARTEPPAPPQQPQPQAAQPQQPEGAAQLSPVPVAGGAQQPQQPQQPQRPQAQPGPFSQ